MSDDFSRVDVAAATHPPGYALHKYWARKPHNVVRAALAAAGLREGDLTLDPFCGSGVPLSEAAALGADCAGFDVNPVAAALTRTTLRPPDADHLHAAFTSLLDAVEARFAHAYATPRGPLRYVVHATVVRCPACDALVGADEAPRRGRAYRCRCGERLAFNLERMVRTRVVGAALSDGRAVDGDESPPFEGPYGDARFDHAFAANARILAHPGLRTRALFTARNFAVLCAVADGVDAMPDPLRDAAALTLTAAAAQCSRLVAHRNGLTSGGPAWTVPGFWVPPLHIEAAPFAHLRARLRRTCRALRHLGQMPGRGAQHSVTLGSAERHLDPRALPRRAAVVFLDPPYGDSVPYLEFSALWNSFLGEVPDPSADLSVSDRARGDATWDVYASGLARVIAAIVPAMADGGRAVVTFNNRDLRAWRALLDALHGCGLRCEGAFYQPPAVVSAKAQLAPGGSYHGDIYSVFARSDAAPSRDPSPLRRAARDPGRDPPLRAALLALLRENLDASCLDQLPEVLRGAGGG